MKVCASSVSPAFGGPTETKKARHRRCFKPLLSDHRHVRIWATPMYVLRGGDASENAGQRACMRVDLTEKERGGRGHPFRSPPDRKSVQSYGSQPPRQPPSAVSSSYLISARESRAEPRARA